MKCATRWWRGWLFASLPVGLFLGAFLAFVSLERLIHPHSRLPFGPVSADHWEGPGAWWMGRIVLAVLVLLSVVLARWGRHARPVPLRAALLALVPWPLGALVTLVHWHALKASLGGDSFQAPAGSLSEALSLLASVALVAAALLLAPSVAQLLGAVGRTPAPPADAKGRGLAAAVLGVAWVSVASAGFAALAGADLFARLAGADVWNGIPEARFLGWTLELDATVQRWAALHTLQLVTATAAFVGLVLGALRRWRAGPGRGTPWLLAGTLCAAHAAHLGTTAHLLSDLPELFAHPDERPSPPPLLVAPAPPESVALRPALSLGADGVRLGGRTLAMWAHGVEPVRSALSPSLRPELMSPFSEPPSSSLVIGLDDDATLESLRCLAKALEGRPTLLELAAGPETEVPATTRATLSRVHPALARLLQRTAHLQGVYLLPSGCAPPLEQGLQLVLGAELSAEQRAQLAEHGRWRCLQLELRPEASLQGLLRVLHQARGYAPVVLAPGAAPCAALASTGTPR